MTTTVAHSAYMAQRHVRSLFRQPWWILITLAQPVIWLLLYGALFRRIVEIPGFGSSSYLDYLTPGILVMTAFFTSGWSGMGLINDIDRGVIARFLVTPASRFSLIAGVMIQLTIVSLIQSAIIVTLGALLGAHYPGGLPGIAVLVGCSILLGTGVAGLSNGLALLLRREESVIAASNLVLLPLMFLSSVFMAKNLMPDWMQSIAAVNPVDWTVEAGRQALTAAPDWGFVLVRAGWLAVFAIACAWLATRAFRAYQRSV
jgi:ABC-2 type transport system permease protein